MDHIESNTDTTESSSKRTVRTLLILFTAGLIAVFLFVLFLGILVNDIGYVMLRGAVLYVPLSIELVFLLYSYISGNDSEYDYDLNKKLIRIMVCSFIPGLGPYKMGRKMIGIALSLMFMISLALFFNGFFIEDEKLRFVFLWVFGCLVFQIVLISVEEGQRACAEDGLGWFPFYDINPRIELILSPLLIPIVLSLLPVLIYPEYTCVFIVISLIAASYAIVWYRWKDSASHNVG